MMKEKSRAVKNGNYNVASMRRRVSARGSKKREKALVAFLMMLLVRMVE